MSQAPREKRVPEKKGPTYEDLLKEYERVLEENRHLHEKYDHLGQENQRLKKEKEDVIREYEEYKARHPETVGVKHGKTYDIKPSVRSKDRKKPGAKPGHPGHSRPVPQKIDNVEAVPVDTCPHCGGFNLSEVQETRTRVVEEIPRCQPEVTEYLIERRYCRCCKRIVEAPFTAALPNARLGIRVMLFVTWLKFGIRMTEEAIPQVLKVTFGLDLSEGGVISILNQVAREFKPFYEQMLHDLRTRSARNMDETSWRVHGEKAWVWAFVTKWEVIYHIATSRGHEVPLSILGDNPQGIDIHDRFSAYRCQW